MHVIASDTIFASEKYPANEKQKMYTIKNIDLTIFLTI